MSRLEAHQAAVLRKFKQWEWVETAVPGQAADMLCEEWGQPCMSATQRIIESVIDEIARLVSKYRTHEMGDGIKLNAHGQSDQYGSFEGTGIEDETP